MSIAEANKRTSKEIYIKYGFTCFQKDGDILQCVLCVKILANSCSKSFQLNQQLNNAHKEQANTSNEYLKSE